VGTECDVLNERTKMEFSGGEKNEWRWGRGCELESGGKGEEAKEGRGKADEGREVKGVRTRTKGSKYQGEEERGGKGEGVGR